MKYCLVILLGVLLFSCGKDVDKEPPKVTFIKPAGNDTIQVGVDSLPILFRLTDNENLQQFSFIAKDSLNRGYIMDGKYIEGKSYEYFGYEFLPVFSGVEKVWIYVTVYDRAYNSTVAKTSFYIQQ